MTISDEERWAHLNAQYESHANSLNKERLVVSAALVNNNRVLVVRRSSNDSYPGMWEFPGGGVDNDETVVGAIKREVREETNLEIGEYPINELMIHPTRTAIRVVMLFECVNADTLRLSHEQDDFYWVDLKSLGLEAVNGRSTEIFNTMRYENQSVLDIVASTYLGL